MPERIKPEEIIAVVVGIEKYADENLDVRGPAGDAVRFVRWLLDDCEVPAANIRLHLSPLDGFDDELGVERHAATTDPIKYSLVDFPEQHPKAKMLILYWIGHGAYIPGNHDQALYLETASQNCLDCLETNTLREFLQKHSWGQSDCLRRFVIIDACANQRRPVATAALELKAYPRNLQSKINLCEMRSASLGQFARVANFSKALLEWLDGSDQNRLLKKTPDLIAHLESKLRAAREDREENEFDQRPVFWQLGDWEGKTQAQFSPLDDAWAEEAEAALFGLGLPDKQLNPLYLRIAKRNRATTLQAMIDDLAEMQPGKDGLPKLLEFVARVADSQLVEAKQSKQLWRLVETHAANKNLVANLKQTLAEEKQQAQATEERLLFDLKPSSVGDDKFILEAWRQTDGGDFDPIAVPQRELTKTEAEQIVADCIEDSNQPFVEFFLSQELLSLGVERWNYFGSAIGDMFPVVVRSRERATGQWKGNSLENWRQVSRRIRSAIDSGQPPKLYWPRNAELSPGKLMPHIRHQDFGTCVAFSAVPEAAVLEAVLRGGAPFAVWPRWSPNDAGKLQREVNAKLGEQHFNRFPDGVRALRHAGKSGADLTLLWDEPSPYPTEKNDPLD